MMFGKIKEYFRSVDDDEAKKIEEGKRLEKIAEEAMKGDKASPEVSGEEKEIKEDKEEKE